MGTRSRQQNDRHLDQGGPISSETRINERIRVIRIHDFTTVDRIETTIEEHLEILEALRAGKQDAAAALMRVHIERSAEVVERRVGELLARMFEEERP